MLSPWSMALSECRERSLGSSEFSMQWPQPEVVREVARSESSCNDQQSQLRPRQRGLSVIPGCSGFSGGFRPVLLSRSQTPLS